MEFGKTFEVFSYHDQIYEKGGSMSTSVEVKGKCDDRFSAVQEAFAKNFEDGLEVGASFAATLNGEFVVDIWAGHADAAKTESWEEDTIVNVWSSTKPMSFLCMLMLVERGLLDLEAPISRYWPEFAEAGKEDIPVKFIMSHQAGLAAIDEPLPQEVWFDWDRFISALEAQKPLWEPGTKSGYHGMTQGFLLGEILKRITGKSMGRFFKEEIALPLNADFHIGLDQKHNPRVAEIIPPEDPDPIEPGSLIDRMMSNPAGYTAEIANMQAWRSAEVPAANGHGNARAIAKIMSIFTLGGEVNNTRFLSSATIDKVLEEQVYAEDLVLGVPIRFGLGFGLVSEEMPMSPNPRTFFWGGWGGSLVVVDLDAELTFSYTMNKMGNSPVDDMRAAGQAMALYGSLMSP